jgi:3-oxoacyl-[acyl-carrier-protein] synthase II
LISPLGIGNEENWRAILEGKSGIRAISRFDTSDFPTQIAGEVRDFDPTRWYSKKFVRQMDLFVQYALAASFMAMEDSGLAHNKPDPFRSGVYVGAGLGGITTIEATYDSLKAKGPRHGISPYFVPAIIINLAAGQISIFHDFRGPSFSHVSACSTGAHSIGEAFRAIQRGETDVMICGGTESTVTPLGIGGFNAARALSTRNDEPTKASRPFTASRDGFVLSEGAGLLILEEWDHAKSRGAKIYAELIGYGTNCDAHHITLPAPEGVGAQRCMQLALADAGIAPEQVGYINAHGTSTVADAIETHSIRQVFGAHAHKGLAVSSTKSMHGHLLGAAGGLEAAITCLALKEGILPPTINLDDPDPECDLDYIPHQARKSVVECAMSNSFGFGGTNAALVFRRVD